MRASASVLWGLRSWGLRRRLVPWRHVRRCSWPELLPLLTSLSCACALLFAGLARELLTLFINRFFSLCCFSGTFCKLCYFSSFLDWVCVSKLWLNTERCAVWRFLSVLTPPRGLDTLLRVSRASWWTRVKFLLPSLFIWGQSSHSRQQSSGHCGLPFSFLWLHHTIFSTYLSCVRPSCGILWLVLQTNMTDIFVHFLPVLRPLISFSWPGHPVGEVAWVWNVEGLDFQAQTIQPEPHFWKIKWGKRD